MRESTLTVGELGRRAGVGAKAIRFWEARGVLPPAARGANGYRLYAPETVEVLRFVSTCVAVPVPGPACARARPDSTI